MSKLKYLNKIEDIRLTKEFVFLNPYKFIVFFIYIILFLLVTVCLILGFTKKQETINVDGSLQLSDKIQDLQVYIDGVIGDVRFKDGDYVEKGQTIVLLKSEKLDVQKQEAQDNIKQIDEQLSYITRVEECINSGKNSFENNEQEGYYYAKVQNYLTSVASLNASVGSTDVAALTKERDEYKGLLSAIQNGGDLSKNNMHYSDYVIYKNKIKDIDDKISKIESLIANMGSGNDPSGLGSVSPGAQTSYNDQLEALKAEKMSYQAQNISNVKQQINTLDKQIRQYKLSSGDANKQAKAEITNLKAQVLVEAQDEKLQLENSKKEIEQSIKNVDADLGYYTINANESGFIKYKSEVKKDAAISAGATLGIISKEDVESPNFDVMLLVKSDGIGFVKQNQSIKLTVYGLDRKDYGYLDGQVKQIYYTPITYENNTYYQVKASVDVNKNAHIYKDVFGLKDGMSVEANIITKETSWLYYLLEKMNIFKDEPKQVQEEKE